MIPFCPKKISTLGLRRIFFIAVFSLFLLLIPASNIYFQKVELTNGIFLPQNIKLPLPPLLPQQISDIEAPEISAQGIYILDLTSDIVLYEKNADQKFLPASTAKIATALVVLDKYQLDDVLTVKTIRNNGKTMGLVPKEQITVESLLYGVLVHSANDAAYVLAENYPGGIEAFVADMNQKIKEYNLFGTHFANPAGFDDLENYTTPKDLAKLAKVAINNKTIAKIISTKNITVSDINYTYFHPLTNVNELLGKIAGVAGVKTGSTDGAGEILVSEVKKNGRSVLFVVLKSKDRFGDTVKLIDWVFNNFAWKNITEIITPASRL